MIGLLIYKYEPFWQEVSVKYLIFRWPLRPVDLLFLFVYYCNTTFYSRLLIFKKIIKSTVHLFINSVLLEFLYVKQNLSYIGVRFCAESCFQLHPSEILVADVYFALILYCIVLRIFFFGQNLLKIQYFPVASSSPSPRPFSCDCYYVTHLALGQFKGRMHT